MRTSALIGCVVLLGVGCLVPSAAQAQDARRALTALKAVSCPKVAVCMAVGTDRFGVGVVVATTDGGTTWSVRPAPPSVEQLDAVDCWTVRNCFVAGSGFGDAGAVYRTLDGGLTWQTQSPANLGGFFLSLSCASAALCVAGGNSGAISTTTDKGRTWTDQRLTGASLINGLDCVTDDVCVGVGYSGGNGVLGVGLRTADGGESWDVSPMPKAMPFPVSVDCLSADTCFAAGEDTIHAGRKQVGRVVLTTDGGATWHRRDVPDGYTYVSGIACSTPLVCEAATLGSTGMLGTTDGGLTWTSQGPRNVFGRAISCPSASVCVAVGESDSTATIHRTTDGGQHWVRQPIK